MNEIATTPSLEKLPCSALQGVGPRTASRLQRCGVHTIADCLFYLPYQYQDRTRITPINRCQVGYYAVIQVSVVSTQVAYGKKRTLRCIVQDATGELELCYFHFSKSQQQQLQAGVSLRCFGEVRGWGKQRQMVHPEYHVVCDAEPEPVADKLTAIYPTTAGLSQIRWRSIIQQCLDLLKQGAVLADYLPSEIIKQYQLCSLTTALLFLHEPPVGTSVEDVLAGQHPAQRRLIIEELVAHQLSLRRVRQALRQHKARIFSPQLELFERFYLQLPFQLTSAQQRVVDEIRHDLTAGKPMMRLVQGDVGSGKTVIAALAALHVISAGCQAAIMVPTELLAEQHGSSINTWFQALAIKSVVLTGKLATKQRQLVLEQIASGQAQLVVGTHALFQAAVKFHDLALVVIDEQHRFGVEQRLALFNKGKTQGFLPHQLVMTATPIPRTLAMTAYADQDISVIDQLPPGRKPIVTIAVSHQRRPEVLTKVRQICQQSQQVYWICTLIDESETLQCQAAENTAAILAEEFTDLRIGLLHGRLAAEQKDNIMRQFKAGNIDILVATTVVEVGVDVANATLMIIENPERLGLAQLHQLRGRVGRHHLQSHCVLLYKSPLSEQSRQRIAVMRASQDGFVIAEHDLALRGPGEVLGTRQTGLAKMRIADLNRDKDHLPTARDLAEAILSRYPVIVPPLVQRWFAVAESYYQA